MVLTEAIKSLVGWFECCLRNPTKVLLPLLFRRWGGAVLVSNDSDLAEALRLVKTEIKKKVGLIIPDHLGRKPSRELWWHKWFPPYRIPLQKNIIFYCKII